MMISCRFFNPPRKFIGELKQTPKETYKLNCYFEQLHHFTPKTWTSVSCERDQNLRNWCRVILEPLGKANPELFTMSHLMPVARLFLEVKNQTILVEANLARAMSQNIKHSRLSGFS